MIDLLIVYDKIVFQYCFQSKKNDELKVLDKIKRKISEISYNFCHTFLIDFVIR